MPKLLQFHQTARTSLAHGVHILASAVRGTLGPKGRFVVLDRPIGKPLVSNDGITIANEIELQDRFENMGVQLVREAAFQTNETAGDGTTTSTILADALIQYSQRALAEGINTMDLTTALERWGEQAMTFIRSRCFPVPDDASLAAVASIAAGHKELGGLIAEVMTRLGPEGNVVMESHSGADGVRYRGGMQFDRGYISHHMVTDTRRMVSELDNAALLVTDQKIHDASAIVNLAATAAQKGHGLFVVAEDYDNDAVAQMVSYNEEALYPIVAIRAPEFGPWRKFALEDLSIFTGARFLARDLALSPERATWHDVGFAGHIEVARDHVTITEGQGSSEAVAGRKESIREQLACTEQPFERDKLTERLGRMSGNTAVIFVGGATTVEQKERMQRAEDAVNAARSALRDGVVAGGGLTYVQAALMLRAAGGGDDEPESSRIARQILCQALEEPLRILVENSGQSPDVVLRQITLERSIGFNALSGQCEDLKDARILDSATSVIHALGNALSVAKMVLNTDVLVADMLDFQDPTEGPARGGGEEHFGMN